MTLRAVIICQGHLNIPFRREPGPKKSTSNATSLILFSYCELSNFLSKLHRLSCSSPSVFQTNAHFFDSQSPLHRLLGFFDDTGLEAFRDPTKWLSITRLACLLWILTIFLDYSRSPLQLAGELQDLKIRLQRHRLDRFGLPMMLCMLLLKKEESLELHPRSWAVVRLMNVIKNWEVSKQHDLTRLLRGYLSDNQTIEAHQQQYYDIMEGIREDLATLNGE
jgi:hypothetical protein